METTEQATILIVDDTDTNIDILLALLGTDYDIVVATDGISALEAVEESPPDLILLDIMMPGMDGYEVCNKLKANDATRDIPIIFLTALSSEEDEGRGLALGADDYISKPFNPELVKVRVQAHIDLKRFRDSTDELAAK